MLHKFYGNIPQSGGEMGKIPENTDDLAVVSLFAVEKYGEICYSNTGLFKVL